MFGLNPRVVADVAHNRYFLGFSILSLICFNIKSAINCGHLSGCMNIYWADFWLVAYSDGYERRALIGQILRFAFPKQVTVLELNIVAFAFAILCLGVFFGFILFRRIKEPSWSVPFVALATGPTVSVLFEVLGDTLQISLLLTILYVICSRNLMRTSSFFASLFTGCIVVLIHEASIFLFLPAIYMAHRSAAERPIALGWIIGIVLFVTGFFVLIFGRQIPDQLGLPLILVDSTSYHPPANALPPFFDLLKAELSGYFGAWKGPLLLARKAVGSFLWPILMVLCWAKVFGDSKLIRIFLFLLLISSPLYSIAHDWGRFAVYTLLLSITISSSGNKISFPLENKALSRALLSSIDVGRRIFSQRWLLSIFPVLYFSYGEYRQNGLATANLVTLAAGLVFLINFRDEIGKQPAGMPRQNG